jgi:hypothetical protein
MIAAVRRLLHRTHDGKERSVPVGVGVVMLFDGIARAAHTGALNTTDGSRLILDAEPGSRHFAPS